MKTFAKVVAAVLATVVLCWLAVTAMGVYIVVENKKAEALILYAKSCGGVRS